MTRAEEKAWVCGVAYALAEVVRLCDPQPAIEEALSASGLDESKLRAAGVDPFDLNALKPTLKRNRERTRRSRLSTEGAAAPGKEDASHE